MSAKTEAAPTGYTTMGRSLDGTRLRSVSNTRPRSTNAQQMQHERSRMLLMLPKTKEKSRNWNKIGPPNVGK